MLKVKFSRMRFGIIPIEKVAIRNMMGSHEAILHSPNYGYVLFLLGALVVIGLIVGLRHYDFRGGG